MEQIELIFSASLIQAQLGTIATANIAMAFYREKVGGDAEAENTFIAQVELSVGEACTNSVKYCPPSQVENSKVHILFELGENELIIKIKDCNPPFDFNGIEEPDFETAPECGYGVHIIKKSMDQVDYRREDGWNIVTMKKSTQQESKK